MAIYQKPGLPGQLGIYPKNVKGCNKTYSNVKHWSNFADEDAATEAVYETASAIASLRRFTSNDYAWIEKSAITKVG